MVFISLKLMFYSDWAVNKCGFLWSPTNFVVFNWWRCH